MTIEQIRQVWNTIPFRSFTLRMNDGRSFHIPHRDFLSVPPMGRLVFAHHTGR
jgi:hypothetical protein